MENINWSKIVAQGRAKSYGISWTEEEAKARASGVSAEDIRSGVWKSGQVSIPNETEPTTATADVKIPVEEIPEPVVIPKKTRKPRAKKVK